VIEVGVAKRGGVEKGITLGRFVRVEPFILEFHPVEAGAK
jgi:hypothetical protein